MRRIEIFDTTLRDGEQTVGVNLNAQEKLEIALRLERLGIDIIEAGFPASSEGALQSVKLIASKLTTSAVAAMARAKREDIDKAWEAISCAKKPLLHVVLATSDLHLREKLGKSREQAIEMIRDSVAYARSLCESVQFSAEDASRSDKEFLANALGVAVQAGARRLNLPDTVGYSQPEEYASLFTYCLKNVRGIESAVLAAHCHNDLGLAVANSLAAVRAGAGQVEGTLVGIGERAGNAALEEIIMALHLRGDYYGAKTGVEIRRLYRSCSIVASLTGVIVAANKPVIGNNIFTHESGIHQHGVLKNPMTYEIFSAKEIGRSAEGDTLAIGKHSGRHAFERHLENMGYSLSSEQMTEAFARFKELCDHKKSVSDEDIEVLISDNVRLRDARYKLSYFHIISGNTLLATATVRLERAGEMIEEAACGDGPIDAIFRALDRAASVELSLLDYTMRAVTGGKDALAEVTVKVSKGSRTLIGRGISTDTLEAGARAYVAAINKFII